MQQGSPPAAEEILEQFQPLLQILNSEPDYLRPRDSDGLPGGLVWLSPKRITVVIPDIHARMDVVRKILDIPLPGQSLFEALQKGDAQLVFVGDYVHAEQRAADRWRAALQEYLEGFSRRSSMDEEMRESLGTLQMLACIKTCFPEAVHLLKGNHENIRNQEGEGNHSFGKFAYEGQMVADYMEAFYPPELIDCIDQVEHSLPLLAIGLGFLVSHAEPRRCYLPAEVRDYRQYPEVVDGLTWTANGAAENGSVQEMLRTYIPEEQQAPDRPVYYFGGHRPVSGKYALRAGGKFIQLHNPAAGIAAVLHPEQKFDPEQDILYI
ncbi:metallophosphoesterase [Spirochaeta dissipatitropha]